MPLLLLLAAAGFFAYLNQAKKFLETIQFAFLDIRLDAPQTLASGLTKVFLKFKIAIKNNSKFEGKLLNFHLDVYYQGKLITVINQNTEIKFNPLAVTTQIVPVTLSTLNAVTTLRTIVKNLLADTSDAPELTFKGYADVTAGRIVINETKKISL